MNTYAQIMLGLAIIIALTLIAERHDRRQRRRLYDERRAGRTETLYWQATSRQRKEQ